MSLNNIVKLSILMTSIAVTMASEEKNIPSYCGSNSVYALLRLMDIDVTMKDITEIPVVIMKKEDLSLNDLQEILSSHGLTMVYVKADVEDLHYYNQPFIAHCYSKRTGGHFVVGWPSEEGIYLIDYPRAGRVPWDVFGQYYTGHAIIDCDYEKIIANGKAVKNKHSATYDKNTTTDIEGPKLKWISKNQIDVGLIGKDGEIEDTYIFYFHNIGNKPLILSDFKASCSCLEVFAEANTIQPKEKSFIKMKIRKDRKGDFENTYSFKGTSKNSFLEGKTFN